MGDSQQKQVPRQLTTKELAALRSQHDRAERYFRTAVFVQSKWFILGGLLFIALFLLITFLVA